MCPAQAPDPLAYAPTRQVQGVIRTWGSPQMGDLLKQYEQGFQRVQPGVNFEDELKSTITAVAGVYTGRADLGLLGREIWPTEVQAFESIAGHPPTVLDLATGSFDVPKATFALMIFVPKTNPIASLSLDQLQRIFAASNTPILTWGDVGLHGPWATRPIHIYGFTIDNDKSQIFGQLVFHRGDRWQNGLREFANTLGPSGKDAGQLIVDAVAADPDGIGISNVHYASPAVRALPLSIADHEPPIEPTRANVASGAYPLTRSVYVVFDQDASHPPSAAVLEFLHYVLSRQGQEAVRREGNYLPLRDDQALRQLRSLPSPP